MSMAQEGLNAVLRIPRMPVSGIEYELRVSPAEADSLDFEIKFILHRKTRSKAQFHASWPCYMSTFDEVELHAPTGAVERPGWQTFGEKELFVAGDAVNYVHRQRRFDPEHSVAFPAVYGRIGPRVLMIMLDRPEGRFFLVNAGGHVPYLPIQNPAWDFSLTLPDYEPEEPIRLQGRLVYKEWAGPEEVIERYHRWRSET
jgi:hypothetical protein